MTDGDDKLLRRYRELARDEPPAGVDAAILDASRRAVASRPWSRRYAGPVSIAAVLVLALGITLNMQQERPGVELPASVSEYSTGQSAAPEAPAPASPGVATPTPPPAQQSAIEESRREAFARKAEPASTPPPGKYAADNAARKADAPAMTESPRPQPRPLVAPPAADAPPAAASTTAPAATAPAPAFVPQPPPPARAAAQSRQEPAELAAATGVKPSALAAPRAKRELADAAAPRELAKSASALPDPAAELERIARLRADGRQDEADKALEAFFRKHPEYRIPDAVWDRVRPR